MSYNDWTQYITGAPTLVQNTGTPIIDAGSLQVTCLSDENATLINEVVYTPGLTKGIMRSLFRVDTGAGTNVMSYGLSTFQSAHNISATGSAYLFGVELTETLADNTVFFDKCTSGVDTRGTRLYEGTPFTRIEGTTIVALEIEWAYEPTILGGTRFILREGHGTDTDFSNLVDLTTIELYTGTPSILLTTSSAEGLFFTANTGGDSLVLLDVFADLTYIIHLT